MRRVLFFLCIGALVFAACGDDASETESQSGTEEGSAESGSDPAAEGPGPEELASFTWQPVTLEAPWAARAGLRVVELDDQLLLSGAGPRTSRPFPATARSGPTCGAATTAA